MKKQLHFIFCVLLEVVVGVSISVDINAATIVIPGSQFPTEQVASNYQRLLGVDTNGTAGDPGNINTRSNFTIRIDNFIAQVAATIGSGGSISNAITTVLSNGVPFLTKGSNINFVNFLHNPGSNSGTATIDLGGSDLLSASNILANLSGGFHVLIPSNATTAQIQSTFNNVTNGAVVEFQPGDYSLSAQLSITNPMVVLGNGSTLHWTNATAIALTNYMFDTGTNYGKLLIVSDLNLDGGVLKPYNTSAYYDATHFLPNGLYGDVYWSNRTAMRIESSGGATITRCKFTGWSGNAILGISKAGQFTYQSGKLWLYFNSFYTNFCDIMLPGSQFEVPGYNNASSSLWNNLTPQYAVVIGNNSHGSQIGIALHAGNTAAQENSLNDDYFGVTDNGVGGSHRIYDNNLNHDTYGVQYTGGGFVIVVNNTIIGTILNAFWGTGAQNIDINNNFFDGGMIATNGSTGFIRNNVTFPAERWGIEIPTNYSSGVRVYNNADLSGVSFDQSQMSIVAQNGLMPQTNFLGYDWVNGSTTTNTGNAVVLTGFDAFGVPLVKGTNWPTGGGGSSFPLTGDVQGAGFGIQNLGTSSFTNSVGGAGMRFSLSFDSILGSVMNLFGTTNTVASPTTLIASNLLSGTLQVTSGNSNYIGGTTTITNIWTSTNTAPTTVTIGTTAPDRWIQIRDLSGNLYWTPAWTNH